MFNKSIMSKVMGKIFSPIVSSLETSEISRYFTTFNSLFNMYGAFSSPVTLSGDFRISFDFSVPAGTNSTFLGGADDFNNRIFINGGEVNGVVGGASLFDSRVPVADSSALNSVVVQRVGVGITITVNGVTGAVKNSGNAFVLDYVGRVNTSYSDGIIANLQIEDLTIPAWGNQIVYSDSATQAVFSLSAADAPTITGTTVSRNDSALTYLQGTVEAYGLTFPRTLFNRVSNLSFSATERAAQDGRVVFDTDATEFELRFYVISSWVRVFVDNEDYGLYENTVNSGQIRYLKISGLPVGSKTIRIETGENHPFGDIVIPTGSSISQTSGLQGSSLCFLGDSFTEGTGAGSGNQSYTYVGVAGRALGTDRYSSSGFGGTGYVTDFFPGFGDTRPSLETRAQWDAVGYDHYIVAIGINDDDAVDITTNINATFDTIRANNPDAAVYVLSPWGNGSGGNIKPNITASIQSAISGRAGFYYIPVWQVEFTKSDSTHPDEAGHKVLGEYIAGEIRKIKPLVVDSSIDKAYSPTSNVIRNDAAVLGGELWSSPNLVGSFTDNGDGFFAKVTGGGGELQKTGQGISNGDAFIVKGFIDGLGVGDSLAIQAGGAPTDGRARVSVSDNGSFEVMVIVETDSFDALRVVASGVDVAFTISNISWRQIPTSTPYITLQNSAADGSSSASYTFDAGENRWEGVDAWVNPVVGSQWVDNMDGSYTLAGDGSSNQLRQEDLNLATYEVSWTVDAIDNAMKVQGFDNAPYLFSTTGGDSFVSFCSGGNLNFDRAGSNVVNATISNISLKQILELPQ